MRLGVSYAAIIIGVLVSVRGTGVCSSWPNGRTASCPRNYCLGILTTNSLDELADHNKASEPSPKDWSLALSVSGNYSKGLGSYYGDSRAGAGFESCLALSVSRDMAIRFCCSRTGIAYSDSESVDEEGNSLRTEPDFNLTSITAGIQWYRWVDRLRQAGTAVYFSLEGGVACHALTVTETYKSYVPDTQPVISTYSSTANRPTLRTGMGLLFPIGKAVDIDVNTGLDLVWVKMDGPDDPRKAVYGIKGFILHGAMGLTVGL